MKYIQLSIIKLISLLYSNTKHLFNIIISTALTEIQSLYLQLNVLNKNIINCLITGLMFGYLHLKNYTIIIILGIISINKSFWI
jgi:hypothetical protein